MLKGKVAVVTGASRGIGAAVAKKLASLGADLALIYAGNDALAEAAAADCRALCVRAEAYRCDVSDGEAVKETVAKIKAELGGVHLLVNNAGITRDGLVATMKEADFDEVLDVNLKGAFHMIRHCSGLMLRAKYGRIVNISSVAGLMGNPGQANYAAAKAGLKVISRPRMPESLEFESYRLRPEILAWYLGDDTSGHCTPMELRDRMDAMKGADGRRLTCQADGAGASYRDYAAGTDIFIPEIYPIRTGDAQNVRDGMAHVSNAMRLSRRCAREAGLATRSVWALMQQFRGWTNWKRFPTKAEIVCSSFSAIANGANGIMWYTYSGGPSKYNKNIINYGAIDDPERWADLKEVVAHINDIKDALVERTPPDQPIVAVKAGPKSDIMDNPSVVALLKRHADAAYVIAVNDTPEAVTVDIKVPGIAAKGEAMWEGRSVSAPGGVVSEVFEPLAVHVYRFPIAVK